MIANPERDLADIAALVQHPGFALLCERFDKRLDEERDNCMEEADDIEAAKLRRAYGIAKTYHPKKETDALMGILKNRIKKA